MSRIVPSIGAIVPGLTLVLSLGACLAGSSDGEPSPAAQLAASSLAESTPLAAARSIVERLDRLHRRAPGSGQSRSGHGAATARSLQRRGGALVPSYDAPSRLRITLPLTADRAVSVTDNRFSLSIEVALAGSQSVDAIGVAGRAVYPAAGPAGGHVVIVPGEHQVEDFVLFDQAPAEPRASYRLRLGPKVAGLRSLGGTLEILDDRGAPRLRMAAPTIVDAEGAEHAVRVELRGCDVDTDPRGPWRRPVVAPGATECELALRWNEALSYPAALDPRWVSTDSMAEGGRTTPPPSSTTGECS